MPYYSASYDSAASSFIISEGDADGIGVPIIKISPGDYSTRIDLETRNQLLQAASRVVVLALGFGESYLNPRARIDAAIKVLREHEEK